RSTRPDIGWPHVGPVDAGGVDIVHVDVIHFDVVDVSVVDPRVVDPGIVHPGIVGTDVVGPEIAGLSVPCAGAIRPSIVGAAMLTAAGGRTPTAARDLPLATAAGGLVAAAAVCGVGLRAVHGQGKAGGRPAGCIGGTGADEVDRHRRGADQR